MKTLPLEAYATAASARGWNIRLPVRAEHVTIEKQVVVYERVDVRRHEIEEQARVQSDVRREELRVSVDEEARMPPASRADRDR